MRQRRRAFLRLVGLGATVGLAAGLVVAVSPPTAPPAEAATQFVNETFTDHANNWTSAAGTWGKTSAGKLSNCPAAGCSTTGIQRAWFGLASNASGYTIDADITLSAGVEECKVIYSNADKDENYRVDIRKNGNQVRAVAGGVTGTYTPSGSHAPITGSATYHLTLVVSKTQLTVQYRKGSETLDTVLTINPNATPDGKIGVGSYAGQCDFDNVRVNGDEGVRRGDAELLPIFGYERREGCNEGPVNAWKGREALTEAQCDRPLFTPWDRDQQPWWNEMVSEMDYAQFDHVLAHNRGCYSSTYAATRPGALDHGAGDMCPRQLTKLLSALTTQGSPMTIGMFDDFPTITAHRNDEGGTDLFDMSNHADVDKYMWQNRWKVFFDTVPSSKLYKVGNRPVIVMWSDAGQVNNLAGNLGDELAWLKSQVQATYGFTPFLILDEDLFNKDAANLAGVADAKIPWFRQSTGSGTQPAISYNGYDAATTVPSYRYQYNAPGCGTSCAAPCASTTCQELPRAHGTLLTQALELHQNTDFVDLEGFTNVIESAGYYRSLEGNDPNNCTAAVDSSKWDYPNQTLNILRRFNDPSNSTYVLEAEAADSYISGSNGNVGGKFRFTTSPGSSCVYNELSIRQIPGTAGYAVGDVVKPGSQLTFKDLFLTTGTYSVDVRYATPNTNAQVCVAVNSMAPVCQTPPATASYDSYSTLTFSGIPLHRGLSTVTVSMPPNVAINIDKATVRQ